jgi:hypothetical protein
MVDSCRDIYLQGTRTKKEKKFIKTFEEMEGFNFVTPVTGFNRPNTGIEDDGGDDDELESQGYFLLRT